MFSTTTLSLMHRHCLTLKWRKNTPLGNLTTISVIPKQSINLMSLQHKERKGNNCRSGAQAKKPDQHFSTFIGPSRSKIRCTQIRLLQASSPSSLRQWRDILVYQSSFPKPPKKTIPTDCLQCILPTGETRCGFRVNMTL